MNSKLLCFWLFVAAGLLAFIVFYQIPAHKRLPPECRILPQLKSQEVTAIQITLKGQEPIHIERTNGTWRIIKPEALAQSAKVEKLLTVLAQLRPAAHIRDNEVKNPFGIDQEFGFADPAVTMIMEGKDRTRLAIGAKTAPGNQIFLQVVGEQDGTFIVDADLLKLIPREANDWRETKFVNIKELAIERIGVTNAGRAFVLQREPTIQLWRLAVAGGNDWWRAYNSRIEEALQGLDRLEARRFVSDDPKADLEAMGLQNPELQVGLGQGTNIALVLQFGKSPTNDPQQVYARRSDQAAIVTVAAELVAPWRDSIDNFRDPHLLVPTGPVAEIEVHGEDDFAVKHQTNDTWQVVPKSGASFQADAELVKKMLADLSNLQVVGLERLNVTDPDMPKYGLATPRRSYTVRSAISGNEPTTNQIVIGEVNFGTNVFARRADERSVYTIKVADLDRLPVASWQLRALRLWTFTQNDVQGATIELEGKKRQITRKGPYEWTLSLGSQGAIEPIRVEETVRGLVEASATSWIGRGESNPARFGISEASLAVTLQLKNGTNISIQFGKEAPSANPYAALTLEGQTWILEFPFPVFRDIFNYLRPG
ncbi:MAG: hypothetical protein C5B50_29655 [Verrucomicrobia bacterium]|nr:MAG: hypothetical protein C5B50_29655 [Verrucomicrobiota bacterium]